MLLEPEAVLAAMRERRSAVEEALAKAKQDVADARSYGLAEVTLLDDEYLVAVAEAELRWIDGVDADLESGELTWDRELLQKFDAADSVDTELT